MKLFAPSYYKDFSCIAGRCRHTCCAGWEIDIDEDAMARYVRVLGYGERIRESIVCPASEEELPHFRLTEGDRCPHLTECGLCRIITELGEDYLCHICREHPRFYNDTPRGREVGLGMSCEEACRLILSSEDYCTLVEVGEIGSDSYGGMFDSVSLREKVFEILSGREIPYAERLRLIGEMFDLSVDILSDEEWREVLDSLEYLNEEHRRLFSAFTTHPDVPQDREVPLERVLAYLIYRHCAEAADEEDFRAALGFCLFCERLLASMVAEFESEGAFAEFARILSEELEYSLDNTDTLKFRFGFF